MLWAALSLAPDEGITVPDLMDETGMSRPWIYQRLQDLARRRQVIQVSRGRWRATTTQEPGPGPERGRWSPLIYCSDHRTTLHVGDARDVLAAMPDGSADCIVTSPPYWGKRDYGVAGQYGREPTPAAYVDTLRDVFREARRVLADDGTCWLNLGDSYSAGGATRHRPARLPRLPR